MVSHFDSEKYCWDTTKIIKCFERNTAKAIMAMESPIVTFEDCLSWGHHPSGNYSVKIGCAVIQRSIREFNLDSTKPTDENKKILW